MSEAKIIDGKALAADLRGRVGAAVAKIKDTHDLTPGLAVVLVGDFLYRITEPALRPIRRLLPNMGGIDLSPVVLILGLYFLRVLLLRDILPALL